ncbi:hypothetical protein BDF19DRAFT_485341 [Syncephalis fuscata]|nr:hypothetical protein BDF19DRAFT_485341 [Syncephalis fuscata]
MNMLVTRGEATPSLLEKNAKKRRVAERRLTGSIASFVDILPEVPRRLLYTSFKGIRMRSNDSIGNTHQRHVSESIQPTNRRRSLSLPALPVLPIRRTQQNRSVLSAFGTFRNRAACHRSTESIKTANHVTGTTPTDAATNNLESNSNVINRNSMMLSDNSSISFINSHLDTDQSNSNHTLPSILSSSPVSARRLPINFESLHLRNSTGSISSIPSPVNSQLIHTTRYGTTVDRHSMQSSMWAESTAITTEDHSARSNGLLYHLYLQLSPLAPIFTSGHRLNEQNTSLTVNDANLHNLEAGDHVIYNESYSQDDVGANLLPRVANDSFEHTINNNDRLNGIENQELEPFSFVVPPPPRRRRRQFHPNALSSRSFPSHRHTNSTRIVAKSCALNENLRTRIRQASLPSLPRVATYTNQLAVTQNSHIEPEFITRIASNCAQQHTSRSQSNRSILQQCQLHLPLVALPHSPIRPSFTSQSNHDRVDVDSQYSTSLSRRRIDLGSYGGLDLGSFGNGGVTECSDEDDIITENILV